MTTSNMNNESAAAAQTSQTPPTPPPRQGATRTDNVALYLPSVLGYEKIARRAAEAVAEQMEFNAERIEDLKTAVAEACMNAIEHGNAFERGVNVAVHMTILPDKLEVRVTDIGRQPLPDKLPEPGSGDMRGWGFFFIQQLVDEMEIVTLPDGGNEIRMVLYLKRQPESVAKTAEQTDDAKSAAEDAKAEAPPPEPETAAKLDAVKPADSAPVPEAKPAADAKASDKPAQKALAPVEGKPGAVQPVEAKPAVVQPVKDQPRAVQPVADTPRAIQPAAADTTKDSAADAGATATAPPEQKSSAAPDDEPSPES